MRLSLNMTNFCWPDRPDATRSHLGEVAAAADASALDTLWVGDHLGQADPTVARTRPCSRPARPWCGSARTTRIRLGTMVAAVTFRPAALLVKAVTTLDVLFGGRAWLGIGAGYHHDEATELGLPMPPPTERFALLEDTLALARRMWRGDRRSFVGQRVHARSPIAEPAPVQDPRPPVLVGGMRQRRTLCLVAQYADACNSFDVTDGGATLRHRLSVLDARYDDVGRPRETVERTVATRLGLNENTDDFVDP